MLYLPITKSWILSALASRVYFACALLAMALFDILIATSIAVAVSGVRSLANVPLHLILGQGSDISRGLRNCTPEHCDVVFLVYLRPIVMEEESILVPAPILVASDWPCALLLLCLSPATPSSGGAR